ncbi:hypothetical protein PCL_05178 [Purpureocillium lilacinum]|uniref:Uncharacterized protein n=1 Tax=Purpureocillium lilacinum TaxID=33203 RepID=A0A2U3DVD5_PURLI|nr:hypothetical protein PCL_05178 [Purpureocillium lilacinum]
MWRCLQWGEASCRPPPGGIAATRTWRWNGWLGLGSHVQSADAHSHGSHEGERDLFPGAGPSRHSSRGPVAVVTAVRLQKDAQVYDVDARDDGPSGKTMPSLFREGFTVYHGHFRRLPFFSRTARRARQRRATREDGPVAVKTDSMSRAAAVQVLETSMISLVATGIPVSFKARASTWPTMRSVGCEGRGKPSLGTWSKYALKELIARLPDDSDEFQSSADSAPLASQTASTYAEASAIEQARKSPGLKRGARRALGGRSAHALPAHDLKPTRDAARRQPQGRRADTPLHTRKLDMFSSVKSSVYKRRS